MSMDIKQILGSNLKKYRKARGYTQMQLAELVDVDQKHISFIESGNTFPSAGLISKIVEKLDIVPKKLFDIEEDISVEKMKENIIKIIEKSEYSDVSKIYNYACSLYID